MTDKLLEKINEMGEQLSQLSKMHSNDLLSEESKFSRILERLLSLVKKKFGESSEYITKITKVKLSLRNHFFGLAHHHIENAKDIVEIIKDELDMEMADTTISKKNSPKRIMKSIKTNVFIVHGHDNELKNEVALFINRLGLNPIIIHEQLSSSKTVIEKIEEFSEDVGFGIILYTPCDKGSKNGNTDNLRNRARQNVVFEHGYLMGKIGRENVGAIVKGDVETPNDISGVVYIKYDGEWKLKIARELEGSGYNINYNKLQ